MAPMSPPTCLAYVFWHWMRAGDSVSDYEAALAAFQRTLAANAPPGLRRVAVFRHGPAPWLPEAGPHYVDWYLVEDSAALDPLNDGAISSACRAAHDDAAARAAGGIAGLYGLRQGAIGVSAITHATWFSKPAGISYEDLDRRVAAALGAAPGVLWSRRMTLGPTPEMCVLAGGACALPRAFDPVQVPMELLWPQAGSGSGSEQEAFQ